MDTDADLPISEHRMTEMMRAVELQVDAEDFGLRSGAERVAWDELVAEFELRCEREGPVWVADAA
jgi:hypothetical protein